MEPPRIQVTHQQGQVYAAKHGEARASRETTTSALRPVGRLRADGRFGLPQCPISEPKRPSLSLRPDLAAFGRWPQALSARPYVLPLRQLT